MKKFVKQHNIVIISAIIFMIVFSRYFLFLLSVNVIEGGYQVSIDYKTLFATIISIPLAVSVFYYLPLLFLVKYQFIFSLKLKELPFVNYAYSTTNTFKKQNNKLFKTNNVIRC